MVADARTRDRVLSIVSQRGPVTAAAIAASLGLTVTGIRRHLDALTDEGVVEATEHTTPPASGATRRGRPARGYVLTSAGHRQMSSQYDDLAAEAIAHLEAVLGPEAVTDFAQRRVADLESRYRDVVAAAGSDVTARARALAAALAEDGFAASARPVGGQHSHDGVQLCQGHCPMHRVAAQFPQFCEAETDAFARLLGVHVQRLATLANGEHVCTTYVPGQRVEPDPPIGTPADAEPAGHIAGHAQHASGHAHHPAPDHETDRDNERTPR